MKGGSGDIEMIAPSGGGGSEFQATLNLGETVNRMNLDPPNDSLILLFLKNFD
jgi:hypothetical protein